MRLTNQQIKDIFQWDISTWSQAYPIWGKALNGKQTRGLELGANNGGGTLFLALYNINTICSDIHNPKEKAFGLHKKYLVQDIIQYKEIDGMNIPYPNNNFDVVIFKSVLGFLKTFNNQKKMIAEIFRILKPGGFLLFAENAKGSLLHQWARRRFIAWGNSWRYVSLQEMNLLLKPFTQKEIKSTGFFAVFVSKPKWLKALFASLDSCLPCISKNWRYVVFGYAVK